MRACLAVMLIAGCGGPGLPGLPDLGVDLAQADLTAPCATCASTPAPGSICAHGRVWHFEDASLVEDSAALRVTAYDPLDFIVHPGSATPLGESTTGAGGCFGFGDVPLPSIGELLLTVTDAAGATPSYALTTETLVATAGQSYVVDAFAVRSATIAHWSAQSGQAYDANGVVVALFFADASRAALNDFSYFETMPVPNVEVTQLVGGTSQPFSAARYLGPTRGELDLGLQATGSLGAAVLPPTGALSAFSAAGPTPTVQWTQGAAASAPHVVTFQRFHAM